MNVSKNSDWEWEYRIKQNQKELELIKKAEEGKIDPDLYNLEMILLSIKPHSKWWRWGYMKSLKRAIKLIKKDNKYRNNRLL